MRAATVEWESRRALTGAARAAAQLMDITTRLARRGTTVPGLLVGDAPVTHWTHYPAADAVDEAHRYRYYYHTHPRCPRGEHGHFHLFRHTGPERAATHLLGIAVNPVGLPLRLFTTNRWVTDERLQSAPVVLGHLQRFRMERPRRLLPVHRWLRALVTLFAPTIARVVHARDARIARARPGFLEDRRTEVLSDARISLEQQVRRIERLLQQP
ncbi:hypothetical protein AAG565_00320 [Fontimonas sp. SYSU GA230001]|uniref:DUF6969 family protein n=1 Tax=Fontimonas sp. SYSU GA230001 TaxID=3142450 RepID=UPI0032B33F81